MSFSPEKNNDSRKAIAALFCLFLAYLYKTSVWDPYFNPAPLNSQLQLRSNPQLNSPLAAGTEATKSGTYPSPEPAEARATLQTAPAAAALNQVSQYPADSEYHLSGKVLVDSRNLQVGVSLLGGRITELRLKNYKETLGGEQSVNLVQHMDNSPYPLGLYLGEQSDARVQYRLVSKQKVSRGEQLLLNSTAEQDLSELVLEGDFQGRLIQKRFKFNEEGYFVDLSVKLLSGPPLVDLSLEWTQVLPKDSPSLLDPYRLSGYTWFDGVKASHEAFSNLPPEGQLVQGVSWVSMADKYFVSSLLNPQQVTLGRFFKSRDIYGVRLSIVPNSEIKLFAGPKSYRILESSGFELKRSIDLGRTAIIAAPLLSLLHLLYDFLGNYGLAIVVLTILVKFALYPLTASSYKQMKSMQDLAPELKRIKEQFKDDMRQQQQETMKLYQSMGVNPLGGCLPILVQMPVFIGLYTALLVDVELRHAPFGLWIRDLSAPEHLSVLGFGVPVMVIIFVASMMIQQWTTPSNMDPAQKKVMLFMPLIFGFMFASMPAGLTLYWLTNNFISIGQQMGLKHDKKASAIKLALGVSLAVFGLAFLVSRF